MSFVKQGNLAHLPKLFLFPNDTCIGKIRPKKVWLQVTLSMLLTRPKHNM